MIFAGYLQQAAISPSLATDTHAQFVFAIIWKGKQGSLKRGQTLFQFLLKRHNRYLCKLFLSTSCVWTYKFSHIYRFCQFWFGPTCKIQGCICFPRWLHWMIKCNTYRIHMHTCNLNSSYIPHAVIHSYERNHGQDMSYCRTHFIPLPIV